MQTPPADSELWKIAQRFAEQGLLFSAGVGFLLGLYLRKIAWGWQIDKCESEIAKQDAKIEKLETERGHMLEIIRTNTKTTGDAVEGFNRAVDTLERIERQSKWDGSDRRSKPGGDR